MNVKIETKDNVTAKFSVSFEGLTEEEIFALKDALADASRESTTADRLCVALDTAAHNSGHCL